MEGKNGKKVAIYSVYIPNYSAGEMTIYQQQVRALLEEDDTREPRSAIKQDLKKDIEDARVEGRDIIVSGDFNCTAQEGGLEGNNWKSWMSDLGLKNTVFERAGEQGPGTGPNSARQIDGIYTSNHINIIKAGYLGYRKSPGDHRTIWMDVE